MAADASTSLVDSHADCFCPDVLFIRNQIQASRKRIDSCSKRGDQSELNIQSILLTVNQELYPENYYKINWPAQRNNVSAADLYSPHSTIFDLINVALGAYESCALPPLRQTALKRVYDLIVLEDENTAYQTIGPVSKMMNLVVRVHVEGHDSFAYKEHRIRRQDFMWLGPEGMMMCGTNGSQLWDVGFITQALVETGLARDEDNKESLIKALGWLEACQMTENPKHHETSYRHRTKGAWPFSTKEQGYTVSDCTGEGLKSVLYLQEHLEYVLFNACRNASNRTSRFTPKLVSEQRMQDAVDTMLSLQNANGGFASYELIRGPRWLEWLNPAEVFGDIMIEYCYPECTTSVITSLAIFRKHYPNYRSTEIRYGLMFLVSLSSTDYLPSTTITDAVKYLRKAQQPSGGWVGSWGICFTYATQFALESLALVGETYSNGTHARRACEFLLEKQRPDGGWGESYKVRLNLWH